MGGALGKADHFTTKRVFLAEVVHVCIKNFFRGSKVLTDILVLGYSKAWMQKQTIVKENVIVHFFRCMIEKYIRIVSYVHIVLFGLVTFIRSKHDTFFLYSYTAYPTSLVGQFINVCHSLPTNFEAPLDAWCTSLHHETSVCGRDEAYFWLAQPIVHMYHTIRFGEENCKS